MNLQEIKQTLNSPVGKELKEYLSDKLQELKNIDNIKRFKTEKAQIIEVDSQQKAYDKLKEILDDLEIWSEEKHTKSEKDRYDA